LLLLSFGNLKRKKAKNDYGQCRNSGQKAVSDDRESWPAVGFGLGLGSNGDNERYGNEKENDPDVSSCSASDKRPRLWEKRRIPANETESSYTIELCNYKHMYVLCIKSRKNNKIIISYY